MYVKNCSNLKKKMCTHITDYHYSLIDGAAKLKRHY